MSGTIVVLLGMIAGAGAVRAAVVERRVRRRTRRLVGTLVPDDRVAAAAGPRSAEVWVAVDALAERVGAPLRRALRRPEDAVGDRHSGRAVLAAVMCLPVLGPLGAALAGSAVRAVPVLQARRHRRQVDGAVHAELPDVVDLLALGVAAGLNLHLAVDAVADAGHGPVSDALGRTHRRVVAGEPLADALGALLELGDPVRPLHDALVGAQRHGVPVRNALDRIAAETRTTRRRRHEEAARKLPVRLLFPLVLCTLPALGLLTVVPLVATSLPSLTP